MYAKKVDSRAARFINDKILFRGKLYDRNELESMPGINMEKACC
jgi:hypothetical protein